MMNALARQKLSRTQRAGLLARTALTVAAGRMGGRPPMPFLEGENALQVEIIDEVRRRLEIAPHDSSDEALRAIEDAVDAEMEAVAEPVDVDAALARATALVAGTAQAAAKAEPRERDKGRESEPHPPLPPQERFQEWGRLRAPVGEVSRAPSLFERVTASFGRRHQERPDEPEPALPTTKATAPQNEEKPRGTGVKEPAKKTAG